jgi:hypothetical protein
LLENSLHFQHYNIAGADENIVPSALNLKQGRKKNSSFKLDVLPLKIESWQQVQMKT